jgi:mediator of RNA polymerase II transcription subunit 5
MTQISFFLARIAPKLNMISQEVALQLDPLVFSESPRCPPKWHSEANDMGLDLAVSFFVCSSSKIFNSEVQQTYLETKIMHDNNVSDVQVWIDRIWKDTYSHTSSIFANIVLKVKKITLKPKLFNL